DLPGILLDGFDILLVIPLSVELLQLLFQAAEKGVEIGEIGDSALLGALEELDLAQDILRRIVVGCRGNKDNSFSPAYLRQFLIGDSRFRAETMGFVDNDVVIFLDALFQQVVQFADGFMVKRHPKIGHDVVPRAGVVLVKKYRRGDNKGSAVKLSGKHGRDIRFSQTDDVRYENAAVLLKNLLCVEDGLLLILQLFEVFRQIACRGLPGQIKLVLEILVEKLQIKLVGRDRLVEPR